MQINFEQERQWWDAKAAKEETDLADEAINRTLRWREIERHLQGVHSILDVGAATGAFSIPLARRGFQVTHLDFSLEMLNLARQKATGLETIRFVQANATDLAQFADRSFDLVLNLDGAISFCGSAAEQALAESCRVTRGTLIASVSHRARMVGVWTQVSLQVSDCILPAVYEMVERGSWHQRNFPENPLLSKGSTNDYFGAFRAFLPGELGQLVEGAGLQVVRLGGIGTLATFLDNDLLEKVRSDARLLEEFLDLCERYDLQIDPHGLGTRQRAGLIVVAKRS